MGHGILPAHFHESEKKNDFYYPCHVKGHTVILMALFLEKNSNV